MAKYDYTDLKMSEDGDIIIENGDFAIVRNQEFIIQSARNRLKTSDPEWIDYVVKEIGANLEDLRGLPNTPDTARKGAELIGAALTRDGLIEIDDLYIKPTPINKDVLVFFVYFNLTYDGRYIGFEINYNLHSGMAVRRV